MFISELQSNPIFYFSVILAVMVSIVLHELAHGIAALQQGDDTPRILGHMTWDPMVHMGPMSIGMLFLVGISWGQMPVNPSNFRSKYGRAYVSFAGPAMNILISLVALAAFSLWVKFGGLATEPGMHQNFQQFLWILGYINVVLAIFNLIPIPPLDGSTVLADVSPGFRRFAQNESNSMIFLGAFIVVVVVGFKHLIAVSQTLALAYVKLFGSQLTVGALA